MIQEEIESELKKAAWTLEEARLLVSSLMGDVLAVNGYYTMLAGGILRTGYSLKDLDIVFVPVRAFSINDILVQNALLETLRGYGIMNLSITDGNYPEHHNDLTRDIYSGTFNDKRVDCIIIRFPQGE